LRLGVAKTNGAWKLREWGHYFVLTDVPDAKFLDELERRTFETREYLVRLFPQAESDPVRDDRRLTVLRVAKSAAEFHSYGGPGGSYGYWNAEARELVIYDDRDREITWDALAGCLTYAFLAEYFPGSERVGWFGIGLAEHVSTLWHVGEGPLLRHPGLETRMRVLRESKPDDPWPGIEEVLRTPRVDWYGSIPGWPQTRLVAWTLMRVLCDETLRTPEFDARWAKVPERYASGWIRYREEVMAREFAFEGVDRAALEKAWRASLCVTR
jgi:hypothetical protein